MILRLLVALFAVTGLSASINAQGSIFGEVAGSDLSIPENTDFVFFGFLNDTDGEIHVSPSDGIGYDFGNWFDDFQNYVDEAAGLPYDYFFYDTVDSEFYNLASTIPSNSFHQEDILLTAATYPAPPTGFDGKINADSTIQLSWSAMPGYTYHVYRRTQMSNGSFFRIDDPSGSLTSGVTDSVYVDLDTGGSTAFSYVLLAHDGSLFSPPSPIITPVAGGCCEGITGNVDQDPDNLIDIGDLTKMIDYLYITHPVLDCPEEANTDGDPAGIIDLGDLTRIIDFLYITNRLPEPCL